MTVLFTWLIRTIGIGGCAFLGLWIYDWGIPGASRVPYLASIPILGDLTTGRAHSYANEQVRLATAGMVAKFEFDALQAQFEKERRERIIAQVASALAQERADAIEVERRIADAEIVRLQKQAAKDKLPGWSEEELKWYERH
ncbi:hypothetical protein MRBLMR1_004887 [Neorhizobium sp. LMR1-1-1.1]